MAYTIIVHNIADEEFSTAYAWYDERLAGFGNRFIEAVEKQIEQIAVNPLLFARKEDGFREARIDSFPYLIICKIIRKKVVLISAIYNKQKSPKKISQITTMPPSFEGYWNEKRKG